MITRLRNCNCAVKVRAAFLSTVRAAENGTGGLQASEGERESPAFGSGPLARRTAIGPALRPGPIAGTMTGG